MKTNRITSTENVSASIFEIYFNDKIQILEVKQTKVMETIPS